MTFTPIVPFGGLAGWNVLQKTLPAQQKAFDKSPQIQKNLEYFKENIGKINTAKELVSDYRLLKVALGAFGLDDDIGNKFYVQKILEEGTLDPKSLGNRLSDKRYFALAQAFSFDLGVPSSKLSDFPEKIGSLYATRQFEIAVGEQDPNMRLALGLERDLTGVLSRSNSEAGYWYSVLGNQALMTTFQTGLGIPKSIGSLDVDKQVEVFRTRARSMFGSADLSQFKDPGKLKDLTRQFVVRAEIQSAAAATPSNSGAVTLMQAAVNFYG